MKIEALKRKVDSLIIENDLRLALQIVRNHLHPGGEKYDELINLTARYNRVANKKIKNTISEADLEVAQNQLTDDLQSFMRHLEASDVLSKGSGQKHHAIEDPIVVLSARPEEDYLSNMSNFFRDLQFENAVVRPFSDFSSVEKFIQQLERKENVKINLLVFDNTDLPYCPKEAMADEKIKSRVLMMQEAANNPDLFYIHYGEVLYWLNTKKARLHFHPANSKFALYARIKEMLDFIATIHA